MSRLGVLMLGWEFPPLVNGGLGVACLGLARALAKSVDLQVVVPRAESPPPAAGFRLSGINQLAVRDLVPAERRTEYEHFAEVARVPVGLDPYAGCASGSSTTRCSPS